MLRTSAVAYDPSDPTNRFAHLTNHCIATEHGDYGKFEATNELFYDDFDAELARRFPAQAAVLSVCSGDCYSLHLRPATCCLLLTLATF